MSGDFDDFLQGAAAMGTAYALFEHGMDRQTQQLLNAQNQAQGQPININVQVNTGDEDVQGIEPVNAADYSTEQVPESWDDFIGQAPMKRQLQVHIAAAQNLGEALPHILLASGRAGVGKTTMARLIAKTMGVSMLEMVPPFNIWTLAEAAQRLLDHDVLFIDEIHILANNGKRGAELLLKALEDKTLFLPDGDVIPLNDITIIGATTDPDLLPETILDRFQIKPYFQGYTPGELGTIAIIFAHRMNALQYVDENLAVAFAHACRGTPRILKEMVLAARNLALANLGLPPTPDQVLEFLEVTPDGMTRKHIHYLTSLFQYQRREGRNGVEYVAGQLTMMQMLHETKNGIGRIERHLVEQGLLDRTPQGRKLTPRGIQRAIGFIAEGKGASDVA